MTKRTLIRVFDTPAAEKPRQPEPWQSEPNKDDELMTDEDVMKMLRVKRQWLRDHTTRIEPIVPHVRIGREIRYSRRALVRWIAEQVETRPTWERRS